MKDKLQTLDDYLAKLNFEGDMDNWEVNQVKLDYVLKRIKRYIRPDFSVCDIGIGDGYTLMWMYAANLKVTGIDIAEFSIDYLRELFKQKDFNINLIHGDISKIKLEENQFDIVTCFDVLEHTPPDGLSSSIESIKKLLKNGGLLIGTLPLREELDNNKAVCPNCSHEFHRYGHFHSFDTIDDIKKSLTDEFQIIKFGEVPYSWLKSNMLNKILTMGMNFVKTIAQRKFDTTVYFVARLKKE